MIRVLNESLNHAVPMVPTRNTVVPTAVPTVPTKNRLKFTFAICAMIANLHVCINVYNSFADSLLTFVRCFLGAWFQDAGARPANAKARFSNAWWTIAPAATT